MTQLEPNRNKPFKPAEYQNCTEMIWISIPQYDSIKQEHTGMRPEMGMLEKKFIKNMSQNK